ncbi:putative cartilage matrix-associated protein isoform X1 [Saimiri boliviensis]|uniref:putative cartilage matrix-associated protein isoform X1 n=1 Tax=Saimiri boliviensis TaxID=27679 RepID=UPI003D76D403
MTWRQVFLLSGFSALVLLSNAKQKIFMQESDASNFLKRRGKRSPKPQDEVNAENRQKLRADELRREYYEEQRNESENFVEEQNDGSNSTSARAEGTSISSDQDIAESQRASSTPFPSTPASSAYQPFRRDLPQLAPAEERSQRVKRGLSRQDSTCLECLSRGFVDRLNLDPRLLWTPAA